jgi:hypothetical protein
MLDAFPPVSRKILNTLAGRLRAAQEERSGAGEVSA